jgi:hypothetical protein
VNKWKLKELAADLPDNKGTEWVDEANCCGKDTSMFVYSSAMPTASQRHKLEKICEGCPVMLTCRYEAIRHLDEGWWGGMDEKQRMVWAFEELFNDTSVCTII